MFEPTTYEIVIRGRANARVLHPLLDDFVCEHLDDRPGDRGASDGLTRLVGEVHDPAHLHGVVAHLTSMNVELVSIAPLTSPDAATKHTPTTATPTATSTAPTNQQKWTITS